MRKLISAGKCRFQRRPDSDYVEDLLELGITEEEAWNYILMLNFHSYFPDPKPAYLVDHSGLTFKRDINGIRAYIKIKIDNNNDNEEVVCISFHKDNKNRRD